jgi:uncharacterized membrane protein
MRLEADGERATALLGVGASLPALLVLGLADLAPGQPLNTEAVAEPIIATLVGSIGLLTAVPITTANREPPRHAPVRPQERVS